MKSQELPKIQPPQEMQEETSSNKLLIIFNVIALISVIGIYFLAKSKKTPNININTIRRVYEGLSPEEMD